MSNPEKHIITDIRCLIRQVLREQEESSLPSFKKLLDDITKYVSRIRAMKVPGIYHVITKDDGHIEFSFIRGAFVVGVIYHSSNNIYETEMSIAIERYADAYADNNMYRHKMRSQEEHIFKSFVNMINSKGKKSVVESDNKNHTALSIFKELLDNIRPFILHIEKPDGKNYYNITTKDGGLVVVYFSKGGMIIFSGVNGKTTLGSDNVNKFIADFYNHQLIQREPGFSTLTFFDETKSNEETIFKAFANNVNNENSKGIIKEEAPRTTPLAFFKQLLDNIRPYIDKIEKSSRSDMFFYITTKDGGMLQFSFFNTGEFMDGSIPAGYKHNTDMAFKINEYVGEFNTHDHTVRWDKQEVVIFKTFMNVVNNNNNTDNTEETELHEENEQKSSLQDFKKFLEKIEKYILKIDGKNGEKALFGQRYIVATKDDGCIGIRFISGILANGDIYYHGNKTSLTPMSEYVKSYVDYYLYENLGHQNTQEETIFKAFANAINNKMA